MNFKDLDIKNCTFYFFNDMINIKNLDPNKIKIDEKSYENIPIYDIGYVTVKNLRYIKIESVNPLYLIIFKIKGRIKESSGNKYLMLVPTAASKCILWTMD